MYRLHHGARNTSAAMNLETTLLALRGMLEAGKRNILVTQAETPVSAKMDWKADPGGVLVMKIRNHISLED